MTSIGLVRAVRIEPVGTHLTAEATAGTTELQVEWAEPFTDEGGVLELAGTHLEYNTSDDTTDTITLAAALAGTFPAGEPVNVIDGGQVRLTYEMDVDLGDGDPIPIEIPFEQRDLWPAGDYDAAPVHVEIDDDYERIVRVPDRTPARDPGFITTGTLNENTALFAGDPEAQRVVMDGTGTPAFEAYDATNTQTVNIDGEENYILGTLATDHDGQSRVEVGPGSTFTNPANEVRFYTGHVDEVTPGEISGFLTTSSGSDVGAVRITPPELVGAADTPQLLLTSSSPGSTGSNAALNADSLSLMADTSVNITAFSSVIALSSPVGVDATMRAGSVGTDTFRDSVDARVTAVAPGAVPAATETTAGKAEIATQTETNTGTDNTRIVTPLKLQTRMAAYAQPLDADLTAIAAVSTTPYGRSLLTMADNVALALDIARASETQVGVAEVATQTETNTGTSDSRIVTPLKLQTRLAAYAQPLDTDLSAIAALISAADKMPYATGAGTWALADLSSFIRTLLDDADAAAALTTLGVSTFIKTLLDDANAADARATLLAKALRPGQNAQTGTTYTLDLTDEDKVVMLTNAAAITLTIPPNSSVPFPNFSTLWIVQGGAGQITLTPGAGVTINSRGGLLKTNGGWSEIKLRKRTTDIWVATGDLA